MFAAVFDSANAARKVLPASNESARASVSSGRRIGIAASMRTAYITTKFSASGQDASGDRLREWMGVDNTTFYDATRVAILPMGFCYPGTGKSGDLPPRPECAPTWRARIMGILVNVKLTLVIGRYAQAWHLGGRLKPTLTGTVRAWRDYWPESLPLPHPNPRNNIWLAGNAWFETDVLPRLRRRVRRLATAVR